jgi:hypothetical protein
VPPVLTNNLEVTVGGTLSMAGIGVASFRYGSQGDNVVEMDVVTGEGVVETCSPEKNDALFWGAIAGLGSFGIITRARLKLRRMKPMSRTYYLLYDDLGCFSRTRGRDGQRAGGTTSNRGARRAPGNAAGRAGAPGLREVVLPIPLTVEYDAGALRRRGDARGLRPYRQLYTDDCPTIDFFERMVRSSRCGRRRGRGSYMHPWIECILRGTTAADCIEQVLADTPPGIQARRHVLLLAGEGGDSRSQELHGPGGGEPRRIRTASRGPAEVLERDERSGSRMSAG